MYYQNNIFYCKASNPPNIRLYDVIWYAFLLLSLSSVLNIILQLVSLSGLFVSHWPLAWQQNGKQFSTVIIKNIESGECVLIFDN